MSHGFALRSNQRVPIGLLFDAGQFGRLFPNLVPLVASDVALEELGEAMREVNPESPAGDNPTVPAGFTYLGQFIDHDLTFDTTPLPEVAIDPLAVHNFRTPKLDLDCLYGAGPAGQPYMFDRSDNARFVLGDNSVSNLENGAQIPGVLSNDLPRSRQGFAFIGDPRNDENLIVAQLHLLLLKFHNKVLDDVVRAGAAPKSTDFAATRRIVTWHYQWIVTHDFLRRLIEPATLDDVLQNGRKHFCFGADAYIPVEFSVAAYRLGHSMVREKYNYNRVFNSTAANIVDATLARLFQFTGHSGTGASVPVPSNWIIDWRRFFELPVAPSTAPNVATLNPARRLDPFAVPALFNLPPQPDGENRLPVRNLKRGVRMGLPSGQAIAAAMKLPALSAAEISTGADGAAAQRHGFDLQTPLWYYILKEAEVRHTGLRLGPVGSRILAEVFVGLLEGDSLSYLAAAPDWRPTLPSAVAGDYTMVDLLNFMGPIAIDPLLLP